VRWSASALKRHCAYPNLLRKEPTDNQRIAMDRGTEFHAAIEKWQHDGCVPDLEDLEIQGWVDLLCQQWSPVGARLEVAWGLGMDGSHIMVAEPRPHVYEPMSGGAPLLTAGRADAAWIDLDNTLWCPDWKTGVWPVDPAGVNLQANAAGLALARRWSASRYVPGIYYARDGRFDWGEPVELAGDGAAQMFAEIKSAAELPPKAIPGDHCADCWERRKKTCEFAQ
jgi:hypothetical protein